MYFRDIESGKIPRWKGRGTMKRATPILVLLVVVAFLITHYAAQVVAQTKESGEVERHIADLKDPSWQIRWYAAEVLGEAKDPRAVEPLIAALGDEIKDVGKGAALALKEITGQDFGMDPAKWREWRVKNK
jgi:HEAT repeat protein